jgi:hypothetical protein
MPNVTMPNGDIVAFPDEMPKEQIRGLIAAKFPELGQTTPQSKEQSFGEGMRLGLKKRALGIAELGTNLAQSAGIDASGAKQLIADVGQQYNQQGTGTGFKGAVAEIAGDPLSYLPVASVAKILGQGALMGATAPTGDENSGLGSNLKNAAGGAAASAVGMGAGKALSTVARPVKNQLGKAGQEAVRRLEAAGVPLTAAQKTGSRALASLESVFSTLPMTSGSQGKIIRGQREAFTKAALDKAGIKGADAGRKALANAADNFGAEYKAITANNNMNIDNQLLQNVSDIYTEATSGRLGQDAANLVKSVSEDIYNSGEKISGEAYQKTRSLLTQKAQSAKDSFDAGLMKRLRGELDQAFERSLPQAQRGVMADINKRYQAFKPIQKAMEGGNAEALVNSTIDPSALYNKVDVGAPLSDLADAGKGILRQPIPDSGTATRVLLQNALTGAGIAGLAGGAATDNNYLTAAGVALAGPKAAQDLKSVV